MRKARARILRVMAKPEHSSGAGHVPDQERDSLRGPSSGFVGACGLTEVPEDVDAGDAHS